MLGPPGSPYGTGLPSIAAVLAAWPQQRSVHGASTASLPCSPRSPHSLRRLPSGMETRSEPRPPVDVGAVAAAACSSRGRRVVRAGAAGGVLRLLCPPPRALLLRPSRCACVAPLLPCPRLSPAPNRHPPGAVSSHCGHAGRGGGAGATLRPPGPRPGGAAPRHHRRLHRTHRGRASRCAADRRLDLVSVLPGPGAPRWRRPGVDPGGNRRGAGLRLEIYRGPSPPRRWRAPLPPSAGESGVAHRAALAGAGRRRAGHPSGVDLERALGMGVVPLPDRRARRARPRALVVEPGGPPRQRAGPGAPPVAPRLRLGGGGRRPGALPPPARCRGAVPPRLLGDPRGALPGGEPGGGGEAQLALPAVDRRGPVDRTQGGAVAPPLERRRL